MADSTLSKYGLSKDDFKGAAKEGGATPTLEKYGLSPEDFPAQVRTERPQSFLPESMQNLGAGLYEGMVKAVTGPIQFSLDAISPETGQKFTEFMNEKLRPTEQIYGGTTAFDVGEIGGQVAPALAIPAGGAATALGRIASAGGLGLILGSSGYQKSTDPNEREANRFIGGVVGGATAIPVQATVEAVSASLNKLANSSALKKGMADAAERVSSTDPMDSKLGQVVEKNVGKVNAKYNSLLQKEYEYAGKVNTAVSGSKMAEELQPLLDKFNSGVDRNGKVRTVLRNLIDQTKPADAALPPDIERLGPNAKAQAIKILGLDTKDTRVPYSNLRTWSDQIDDILKAKGQQGYTDPQLGLLREAKQVVDSRISDVQKGSPELQKLFRQTRKYKTETVDLWRDPEFRALFQGTPAQRLQGAVKIAKSDDVDVISQMARMLDKKSREQVQSGLIKDALVAATKEPGSPPDPVKFGRYFDRKSLNPLLDDNTRTMVAGMKNLMSQAAFDSNQAAKLGGTVGRAAGITEKSLAIGGLWHLMTTGDLRGALLLFSGNLAAHALHSSFDKMLNSATGRALLVASSRAKPGSPAMAKLADTVATKFPLPNIIGQGSAALTE